MSARPSAAAGPSPARCMELLRQLDAQVQHHLQTPAAAPRPAQARVTPARPQAARPAARRRYWIAPAVLWACLSAGAGVWLVSAMPATSAAPAPVPAAVSTVPASTAVAAAAPASAAAAAPASAVTAAMARRAAAAALGLRDIEPATPLESTTKETP